MAGTYWGHYQFNGFDLCGLPDIDKCKSGKTLCLLV